MPIKLLEDVKLKVEAKNATHATMELYGTVGGDFFDEGVTAKDVVKSLKDLPSTIKTLDLHINSPGGSVFEGMAIYNRLKTYGEKVDITVHIDGLSASIASIIMLAGKKIKMGETGFVMIHKPWSYAVGNADDLEKTVTLLDDIENQMLNLYVKRTGLSRVEIKDMLAKETWMDSTQAKDLGFIDEVSFEEQMIAASCLDKAKWLSKVPHNVVTKNKLAQKKIDDLKSKINGFLKK